MTENQSQMEVVSVSSGGDAELPKVKLTCENCVRAKVRCTGPPGPCERCAGWRKLDCVFVEERKRGRPKLPEDLKKSSQDRAHNKLVKQDDGERPLPSKNSQRNRAMRGIVANGHKFSPGEQQTLACVTTDCWSKIVTIEEKSSHDSHGGLLYPPSVGLSPEQSRVVEVFFELYKNHASNRSCCKAWFSRQLNKVVAMLKLAGSSEALVSLVEWMNRHQIMVSPVGPPENKAFRDPDSGFLLPPMTAAKGPLLKDNIVVNSPTDPQVVDATSTTPNPTCACIKLSYTRDEVCTVQTSPRFVEIFGKDAAYFTKYLDNLFGGILPWGADVFANILLRSFDVILLIRLLAYRFMHEPRMMDNKPITRRVQSSHIFPCKRVDGSWVDCVIRLDHLEHVSPEGVSVDIMASFEPYTLPPPVACSFNGSSEAQTADLSASAGTTPSDYYNEGTDGMYIDEAAIDGSGQTMEGEFQDQWMEDLLKWVDAPQDAGVSG